jgi:CheY-like chemotaxis protein
LIESALQGDGIACATTRVENREDFVAMLEGGGVDLVFSDFAMPALLYTSGCVEDTLAQSDALETGIKFLAKPYSPALLARRMREVLDR